MKVNSISHTIHCGSPILLTAVYFQAYTVFSSAVAGAQVRWQLMLVHSGECTMKCSLLRINFPNLISFLLCYKFSLPISLASPCSIHCASNLRN